MRAISYCTAVLRSRGSFLSSFPQSRPSAERKSSVSVARSTYHDPVHLYHGPTALAHKAGDFHSNWAFRWGEASRITQSTKASVVGSSTADVIT